ncbi:MAG: sulfite exporter TauE/SafE family protein, partial [Cyclobacteriaceae bacterium]
MNYHFFGFNGTSEGLIILALVAFLIGMAKTGVHGAGMMAVPLLAEVFGGRLSSGVMLPILIMADIMGVWYYRKHASWVHLRLLFPWATAGVVAGTVAGNFMDDGTFKTAMSITIIISVGIMIWLERRPGQVPVSKWFGALSGVAGGFTSMIGNLAGSVMAVYFLSVRLPKNVFIGTTAWFFMVLNVFKVPFH